jgi:hypothetical protein
LKEGVMLKVGGKYMMTRPLDCMMLDGEATKFYYDEGPLTVTKLTDQWATVTTPDAWTVKVNINLLSRNVIPERDYHLKFLKGLKEQTLTEMPAKAGEGPRAILATIWKEECRKELDKMPIYKKHTPAGYRRKAKDEMVRMELNQFFKLGDLRDLSGVKDQKGRKHDVKAILIAWGRPTAWRGDGGIFKSTAEYMKMIPIMREVFQRFIQRVQESGLKIMGYNSNFSSKEMFSFASFDLEADLRRESGNIELFFEESDALLRKSELKAKLEKIFSSKQGYKRVIDSDEIVDNHRYSRRARRDDEVITLIPRTLIDDLKYFAGDVQGELHMMSMVDKDSDAAKDMEAKINAIRAARTNALPDKINRGKPDLEKLLAQAKKDIENVMSYSPYEISVKIAKPSPESAEWLFDNITNMKMRDYTKPYNDTNALKHQWVKNAEWLFVRIGDRKSVSTDSVE